MVKLCGYCTRFNTYQTLSGGNPGVASKSSYIEAYLLHFIGPEGERPELSSLIPDKARTELEKPKFYFFVRNVRYLFKQALALETLPSDGIEIKAPELPPIPKKPTEELTGEETIPESPEEKTGDNDGTGGEKPHDDGTGNDDKTKIGGTQQLAAIGVGTLIVSYLAYKLGLFKKFFSRRQEISLSEDDFREFAGEGPEG